MIMLCLYSQPMLHRETASGKQKLTRKRSNVIITLCTLNSPTLAEQWNHMHKMMIKMKNKMLYRFFSFNKNERTTKTLDFFLVLEEKKCIQYYAYVFILFSHSYYRINITILSLFSSSFRSGLSFLSHFNILNAQTLYLCRLFSTAMLRSDTSEWGNIKRH